MTQEQRILTALRLLPPLTSPALAKMLCIRVERVCKLLARLADDGKALRCGHAEKGGAIMWSAP